MADKENEVANGNPSGDSQSFSRRDIFKAGVVGAAALAVPGVARAADPPSNIPTTWHYEADVIVVGAGASGMPVAIRARDAGLSVIVIDQNFDVGGKMLHSGAQISLGGGDPVQVRDIMALPTRRASSRCRRSRSRKT